MEDRLPELSVGVRDRPIDAMPTKQLFIDMLTRDISLIPAILDLVDNCVDGARRQAGDGPYDDYWVRIALSDQELRIADNCGGMSVEVAEKYAFRFGRDENTPVLPHSIGQFGVGMKRAIFKIGDEFRVESCTPTARFVVLENIPAWAEREEWKFRFASLEEDRDFPQDAVGTILTVSNLHADVARAFEQEHFRNRLREELRSKLTGPITNHLAISLQGRPIHSDPFELVDKRELAPARAEYHYPSDDDPQVSAQFFVGLADGDPPSAGWHVFCNGRLILEGDKTSVTGWGSTEDTRIPRFHGQYNQFRGYAYFDSDDAGLLPWNTTKTGLDLDSSVYRASKLHMRRLMRPVIDLLNKLKAEKEATDSGPLQALLDKATRSELAKVKTRERFVVPKFTPQVKTPAVQRIQYDVRQNKAKAVKRYLGAPTWVAVGKTTFKYFYDAEIGDE